MTSDYKLSTEGSVLKLSCYVWHHASWKGLVEWLKLRGAKKVRYISEEDIDPFERVKV